MDLPRGSEASWGEEIGPILYRALFLDAKLLPPKEFVQKFRDNIEKLARMVERMAFDEYDSELRDSDTMSIIKSKLNEFRCLEEVIQEATNTFSETKQNLSAWADSISSGEESVGSLWLVVIYPKEDHLSPEEFSRKFWDNIDRYMVSTQPCSNRDNLPSELENPTVTKKMFKEKAMELRSLSADINEANTRYAEMFTNLPEWAECSFDDLLGAMLLIVIRRFVINSNQELLDDDMLRSNDDVEIHQIINSLVEKAKEFEVQFNCVLDNTCDKTKAYTRTQDLGK